MQVFQACGGTLRQTQEEGGFKGQRLDKRPVKNACPTKDRTVAEARVHSKLELSLHVFAKKINQELNPWSFLRKKLGFGRVKAFLLLGKPRPFCIALLDFQPFARVFLVNEDKPPFRDQAAGESSAPPFGRDF